MAVDDDAPGELIAAEIPSAPEEVVDYDAEATTAEGTGDEGTDDDGPVASPRPARSPLLPAFVAGLVAVVALGALSVWLGYRAHESQQIEADRAVFLQVAKQGALNLTTIDYEHADTDIQRILGSATGLFHDEFSQRSQPFVDMVEKAKTTSQGTVTEAGLESFDENEAQAIIAVSVKTAIAGAPVQDPRSWRMRLTMQKSGEDVKISNVGFVA